MTPPPPEPSPDAARLWFKEIVTALLAFAVLIALFWAYCELSRLPDPLRYPVTGTDAAAIERAARLADAHNANVNNIVTALFGIFAAFVGYYAGRVPAEKAASDSNARAQQAQHNAETSQNQAAQAQASEHEVAKKLQQEREWSQEAAELLDRAAPLLGSGEAVATSDDSSKSSLASEIVRHVRRRNRTA